MNQQIGNKGNNQGIIFSPYIPITTTSIISDGGFSPSKILKSRYSTVMINNNSFYGNITIEKTRNEIRKEKIENIFQ